MMNPNTSSCELFSQFAFRGSSSSKSNHENNPLAEDFTLSSKKAIPILSIEDLHQVSPNAPSLEVQRLSAHQPPITKPTQRRARPVVSRYFQNSKSTTRQRQRQRQPIVSRYFQNHNKSRKARGKTSCATPRATLSSAELYLEAYRRKSFEDTWTPPPSGIRLLQQDHAFDPWRVLVICMLLNRTTGRQAKQVIPQLFTLCPTPQAALEVSQQQIEDVIRPLGFQRKRSRTMQQLSEMYLKETWTHVTQLPGVGKYGADAHAIFCTGYWTQLLPEDHMLNYYWEFLHSIRHLL